MTACVYSHLHSGHYFFSLMPSPPSVRAWLAILSLLDPLPLPSAASRSRKSCHSSASDSLLLELLAMSMGSAAAECSCGVDGVRRKGVNGMRSPDELDEVPGRARPACSFCSVYAVSAACRVINGGLLPSVHPSNAEINCSASNFFGSLLSMLRKCRK